MAPSQYTKITLAERPKAEILPTTFKTEVVPFDLKPGPHQILVKLLYISIDPAMRGWLRDTRSYLPPVKIGEVMRAGALAEVVETGPESKFAKGDIVYGTFGMCAHLQDVLLVSHVIREFRLEGVRCIQRQGCGEDRVGVGQLQTSRTMRCTNASPGSVQPGLDILDYMGPLGTTGTFQR